MFKVGDEVIVVSNLRANNYPVGFVGKITSFWEGKDEVSDKEDCAYINGGNGMYLVDLKLNNKIMSDKFYRVKKETYMWAEGAILRKGGTSYTAVDDIWNVEGNDILNKYLSSGSHVFVTEEIVENSPDWFERVYSVKSIKGMYYVAKDKMKELLGKGVVDGGDQDQAA